MTSQGHAYARFKRALSTRNPTLATAAAQELEEVALDDALGSCCSTARLATGASSGRRFAGTCCS